MAERKGNVLSKLSDNARVSVRLAQSVSRQLLSKEVKAVHLFLGILLNRNSLGARTLQSMDVDVNATVRSIIGERPISIEIGSVQVEVSLSNEAKDIIR